MKPIRKNPTETATPRLEVATASNDHDRCAQEQVQIIGRIQPHGLLFALSEPDLIVRQVSANTEAVLGVSHESLLGCSFETVLGTEQFARFRSRVQSGQPLTSNLIRTIGEHPSEMNCLAHREDDVLIVELEQVEGAHSIEPVDIDAHLRIPLSRIEAASDIMELSERAASEVRKLSGYDRVLVYRFDEEWSGEVVAESLGSSLESYRGLRFPASDIPPQVRRLFLINPLRTIADIDAKPVAIVPAIGPLTERPLDLTRSALRSAAPIHIEYLRNMGVQATMTISVVVEKRLWGMIACHDPRPRRLDHATRSVCELIGQSLASQVALRTDNAALQSRLASRSALESYMGRIEASRSLADTEHLQSPRLLQFFDADGFISCLEGVVFAQGITPEQALMLPVIGKLRGLSMRGVASSRELSELDPGAAEYSSQASGAMYLGLNGDCDYLLFLRQELVETVSWAGNPHQAVSTDEQNALHPRASFAIWSETVRGRSRRWTESQLEGASLLREQLLRVRDAQKLLRLNEALGSEITQRKAVEEDLKKAKAAADAANLAKGTFLATMSHEIRTPINGILGMTDLTLETELTSEQRDLLQIVKSSADSLLSLINDILDFSKIEADKLDFETIEFMLRDTLEDAMKGLAVRAQGKGLELVCHVLPDVPERLLGDPTRIRQIVINLIGNAIKFTGTGEVVLTAELQEETSDTAVLHFSVRDTGVGIPAGQQQLIFEAFSQADSSTTRKFGGTGLGLSISSRLVTMMGGRIWVESEAGRGSTFHFTLRLGLQNDQSAKYAALELEGLRDKSVLIVVNNATNSRILEEMARSWKMRATSTDHGVKALTLLRHAHSEGTPFALVLLDAQLPGMQGFDVAEQMIGAGLSVKPFVIMLSSAGLRGDAARCRTMGISGYLTKPVKQSELLGAIRVVLGQAANPTANPSVVTLHSMRQDQRRLRILLVEDNNVNEILAVRVLGKRGHEVTVARDGQEALDVLEKMTPDLILMDVQMPVMDGFEATRAIREGERKSGKHIPIIAMTANAMVGDKERCLAAGMDAYASKPLRADDLFFIIDEVLLKSNTIQ